ncbi:hypothetical protein AB0K14_01405 [Actinosynnema sp. NPDC050801]|uniref:hypothetical protein n=1 Tax=unclassified Actinosynnema TaxID=2637065 RepID=UPI0033E51695
MTSSQVPTQPQRTNGTPTVRIQPVATTPEPAWPTTEPMTATDLMPVAAATTKFPPVILPAHGTGNRPTNGTANGRTGGTTAPAKPTPPVAAAPVQPAAPVAPIPAKPTAPVAAAPAKPTAPVAAAPAAPVAEPTAVPAPAPAAPVPAAAPTPAPERASTPPAKPRSKLRRIARRIVGPTLLTKKN